MYKTKFLRTVSILSCLILLLAAGTAYAGSASAYGNWDRPKGDYKVFDLESDSWPDCRLACDQDDRCKAWVYFKPRCEGNRARCHLKSEVTPPVYNTCCVSGLKELTSPQAPVTCPKLAFYTTSPLPSTVIGGTYSYQIKMSSGAPPYEFCPMMVPPDGTPPKCDRSADQRFSMPAGLILQPNGVISGQVKCVNPEKAGTDCGAGYRPILIQVRDHCPTRSQVISRQFWIDIKAKP
ncbi:MAG: PAN domain-containing protein [Syntrophaceae bacterium]|nr:PAN domain-containing protein [Syntrophaceae bacterium]